MRIQQKGQQFLQKIRWAHWCHELGHENYLELKYNYFFCFSFHTCSVPSIFCILHWGLKYFPCQGNYLDLWKTCLSTHKCRDFSNFLQNLRIGRYLIKHFQYRLIAYHTSTHIYLQGFRPYFSEKSLKQCNSDSKLVKPKCVYYLICLLLL